MIIQLHTFKSLKVTEFWFCWHRPIVKFFEAFCHLHPVGESTGIYHSSSIDPTNRTGENFVLRVRRQNPILTFAFSPLQSLHIEWKVKKNPIKMA